jgi:pectin methylesterase-like acyl-CoA thioesterase
MRAQIIGFTAIALGVATNTLAANTTVCASGCAYGSIQSAINAAVSGDIITIGSGRYVENVTIAGKNLRLIGAGNGRTVVDGNSHGSVFKLGTGQNSPAAAIQI